MKNYFLNKAEEREKKDSVWDFQTALGDTIRAKYASKYPGCPDVKIIEIKNIYDYKGYISDNKKVS